jgi:nucleoside-diphosphate-sugar epimerase
MIMRAVIIGGSGHVGTYLVPRLVEAGYEVINITRGQNKPYLPHAAWTHVQQVIADRDSEDRAGTFGRRIVDLKPDIVIDMICFTPASAQQLVESLRGQVQHFLHCGTIWIYGHSTQVPATEEQPRRPFHKYTGPPVTDPYQRVDYGVQKAEIESYLLCEARVNGFPATALHAGHIVGPGYNLLNPQGNFNPQVFVKLARGEELLLANFGLETVHHVHADDVAQAFMCAIARHSASVGEAFHVVSPAALTLRGYAEAAAAWFGKEAHLKFVSWEDYRQSVSTEDAEATWDHIAHSPNASIAKARSLIGYQPRYSSLQATHEAAMWLIDHDVIQI